MPSLFLKKCGKLDLGQLPDAHPVPLSLPFLNRTGGEKKMKKLVVKMKTGRSLTYYSHRQNRLDSRKINLFFAS